MGSILSDPKSDKLVKVCNEGFLLNNGERILEVACDVNGEWSLPDGKEIPKYPIFKTHSELIEPALLSIQILAFAF